MQGLEPARGGPLDRGGQVRARQGDGDPFVAGADVLYALVEGIHVVAAFITSAESTMRRRLYEPRWTE